MKLLLYADLQATDGSEVCFHDPSVRLQDWRVRRFFEIVKEVYAERGCEGLIDLGDTTDDRSSIPVPTIDTLIRNLKAFEGGWNVKLIGNHEQFTKDARVHVGKLFEHRFTVVDKVTTYKCPDSDAHFVFAAFPGSYPALVEELNLTLARLRGKKTILMGHFQVVGSQLNSGLACDGVPKDLIAQFTTAFLGHVHKPQSLAPHAYYVGSPFQQNFGESGESKRIGIFDTQTLAVEWVSLADYDFPVYRTVTAKEFAELAKDDSEDRFHVVLTSQADTEAFYAHPLCNRAEAEYSYTTSNSQATEAPKSWSFGAVLARYLAKNQPKNAGIDLSDAEMLDIGTEIANGNA